MRRLIPEEPGHTTVSTGGISIRHQNIIEHMSATSKKPRVIAYRTLSISNINITNPELTHADKVMNAIASLSSILKCKPSIANKHKEEIRELQQLMSSNPGFVRNDTRQEVERTSGRAFKLSKNSYETPSESPKNLFEKTSESQEAPRTNAGERSSTRLLTRKSAERSRDDNQSSPKTSGTAPRVQQPHAPSSRVQQRSTAPPEVQHQFEGAAKINSPARSSSINFEGAKVIRSSESARNKTANSSAATDRRVFPNQVI
jgi:hypothetical protein